MPLPRVSFCPELPPDDETPEPGHQKADSEQCALQRCEARARALKAPAQQHVHACSAAEGEGQEMPAPPRSPPHSSGPSQQWPITAVALTAVAHPSLSIAAPALFSRPRPLHARQQKLAHARTRAQQRPTDQSCSRRQRRCRCTRMCALKPSTPALLLALCRARTPGAEQHLPPLRSHNSAGSSTGAPGYMSSRLSAASSPVCDRLTSDVPSSSKGGAVSKDCAGQQGAERSPRGRRSSTRGSGPLRLSRLSSRWECMCVRTCDCVCAYGLCLRALSSRQAVSTALQCCTVWRIQCADVARFAEIK